MKGHSKLRSGGDATPCTDAALGRTLPRFAEPPRFASDYSKSKTSWAERVAACRRMNQRVEKEATEMATFRGDVWQGCASGLR